MVVGANLAKEGLFTVEERLAMLREVTADLPNVRVLALAGGTEAQTLFCNMGPIRVRAILNRGDEGPLPTDVTLEGLQVSTSGVYDILNALVGSNGNLRLVVDDQTTVVPAEQAVGASAGLSWV